VQRKRISIAEFSSKSLAKICAYCLSSSATRGKLSTRKYCITTSRVAFKLEKVLPSYAADFSGDYSKYVY
jgi:hypothetical protein